MHWLGHDCSDVVGPDRGGPAAWYDPMRIWRDWADDVTGSAIDSGPASREMVDRRMPRRPRRPNLVTAGGRP